MNTLDFNVAEIGAFNVVEIGLGPYAALVSNGHRGGSAMSDAIYTHIVTIDCDNNTFYAPRTLLRSTDGLSLARRWCNG